MHIMHVALGGCITAPPIRYGITQDTGGHIAYLLGAASAQVAADPDTRVTLVTRAFDEPALGADHAIGCQSIGERLRICRLRTASTRYLTKSALTAELPALRRAFLALVETERPDVIHAHFADACELALAAARRTPVPVIYTPHSLALDKPGCTSPASRPADAERVERERRAVLGADAIVVSSDDEARHQVRAYDPDAGARCVVVRPGVRLARSPGTELASALIEPFLDEPDKPFLLAVARPVRKKNLPALLDAYGRDARLRRHANLVVVAGQHERIRAERDEQTAELERLHALVARHGLDGAVALPPSHAPETVTQLYRLAARRRGLFVNPARHEPFGLTLIEAARFGLPVVATRRGGPSDIVPTLGHGLLVDPENGDEIATACRSLLEDTRAYDAASRSAIARRELYSWSAWARSVDDVIARLRTVPTTSVAPSSRHAAPAADTPYAPRETGTARAVRRRADGVISLARTRPVPGTAHHLLAFDIDDTLTGCPDGARRFRHWIRDRRPDELPFAVATGRELPEAIAVIERWRLPRPDLWLTSVGTEIWRPTGSEGELVRCEAWSRHLSHGWDREAILRRLGEIDVLHQHPRTQRPWKVSLFGTANDAATVKAVFDDAAFDVRVVASHGRFIDILPRRAGKASAIEFEAARHGLPMSRCVSAGNSGNDTDMLRRCGKAILVANALPEIGELVDRSGLHRASAPYAHGVLEGLAAFGLSGASRVSSPRSETAA